MRSDAEEKRGMEISPEEEIVEEVMARCIGVLQKYGGSDREVFRSATECLPAYFRELADRLEAGAPGETGTTMCGPVEGYDVWASTYDQKGLMREEEERLVDSWIGDVGGMRVLDVGCGTGSNAIRFARRGAIAVGIDPSREMLKRARQKAAEQELSIDFRLGSVDSLNALSGTFDVVVSSLVLSHVTDLSAAIQAMASKLRASGRLILSVPHPFRTVLAQQCRFALGGAKYCIQEVSHSLTAYIEALLAARCQIRRMAERALIAWSPKLPTILVIEAEYRP